MIDNISDHNTVITLSVKSHKLLGIAMIVDDE